MNSTTLVETVKFITSFIYQYYYNHVDLNYKNMPGVLQPNEKNASASEKIKNEKDNVTADLKPLKKEKKLKTDKKPKTEKKPKAEKKPKTEKKPQKKVKKSDECCKEFAKKALEMLKESKCCCEKFDDESDCSCTDCAETSSDSDCSCCNDSKSSSSNKVTRRSNVVRPRERKPPKRQRQRRS